MSALIVAVNAPVSSTPSRLKVLKPGSVNVTVYVPGRRSTMRVLPAAVGHDGADFFDEYGAARFDGDAREHRARRVFHRPRDRGLCERDGRHKYRQRDDMHDPN